MSSPPLREKSAKDLPEAPALDNRASPAQASHDIFFAAVATTRMPMIVTDPHQPDNPIVFSNPAFERMTGYSKQELFGSNCRFLQGPETDQETVSQVRDAIARREEIAVEILNYRKNGSTFWNALFVSPVFDEAGELVFFFGSQLDISRRREAEEALHQAQKMEAVGQLTGGIAHDFNNLLQVILGYVDVLEPKVADIDRTSQRAVQAIGMAAQRGATLTQQLLAFARKQELRDRLVNFNTLIQDFGLIIDRNAGEGIRVRRELDDDLWNTRIDPVQIEMAILNILNNASDAMGGQGVVTIATRNEFVDEQHPLAARVSLGEYAVVSIFDDGPGIPADVIDKVFDPFFSTKEVGKGTGLGLASVYGFVRQSGGAATARNRDEGGACIELYFPRASGSVEIKATPLNQGRGGDERILMVEDQRDVAEMGAAILRELGYAVEVVGSARAALDVLAEDQDFQLVFSDIVMPGGITGVTLAKEVKRRFPRIAVLLTTGYSDRALEEAHDQFEVLRKPYRRAELGQRVRTLLDGPSGVA